MNTIVKADAISVDFPLYGTRSLKNTVLTGVTGGLIKMADRTTTIRAINEMSFEMHEGERIGLWGHNGSGKTTLLKVIARICVPSSGVIDINGSVASLLNISLGMSGDATGIENIYLRAAMMGLSKQETSERLRDIVAFTELGEFINFPIKTYSSGMQMRLAFAVSTCTNADIILMDEWLAVGDDAFQQKASERLNEMLDDSKLLVVASHDRGFLERTCSKILHMEHGKIIEEER